MKVKTLLKKAIKIAKAHGLKSIGCAVFNQRIENDDGIESMELVVGGKKNKHIIHSRMCDFQEKYTIENLLIKFEASAKEFASKKTDKDLEV